MTFKEFLVESKVEKVPFEHAYLLAKTLKNTLSPFFSRLRIAGSLRRKEKMVGDIDLVGAFKKNVSLMQVHDFIKKNIDSHAVAGEKLINFNYKGRPVNLYLSPDGIGAMMMSIAGPGGCNIGYRKKAAKLGYKLNQYGLWSKEGILIANTERGIYKALNKPWKKPSLRGKK